MTITEQLQFSVLTAPVATLDRRTLSQAWYSALYGNGAIAAAHTQRSARAAFEPSDARPLHAAAVASPPCAHRVPATHERAVLTVQAEGTPAERRAPRSPLARKIERAFLRTAAASHKASFTVEGDGGRVHVLLHGQGSKLELIAICPPKARSNVAAALAQARYALARRGIDLQAQARTQAPC